MSTSRESMIGEAPTFYPNEEEFMDPMDYISKMRYRCKGYGMCRIVPPSKRTSNLNWSVNDVYYYGGRDFVFPVQRQRLSSLVDHIEIEDNNKRNDLIEFLYNSNKINIDLSKKDEDLSSILIIGIGDGVQKVDLFRLWKKVSSAGGFQSVHKNIFEWKVVCRSLLLKDDIETVSKILSIYSWFLLQWEVYFSKSQDEGHRSRSRHDKEELKKPTIRRTPSYFVCEEIEKLAESPFDKESREENVDEGKLNMNSYRMMGNEIKRRLFNGIDVDLVTIESWYWKILSDPSNFRVDIPFPHAPSLDLRKYVGSPRHGALANIPKLKGNFLSGLQLCCEQRDDLPGVTSPLLHVGMISTTYSWQTSPEFLYSISYLHSPGSEIIWYAVPPNCSDYFEENNQRRLEGTKSNIFPMINPETLCNMEMVPSRVVQQSGEFVVFFPHSYHASVCTSFCVWETCGFALEDWIPLGRLSKIHPKSNAYIPFDRLICTAQSGGFTPEVEMRLREEVSLLSTEERHLRELIASKGTWKCFKIMEDSRLTCSYCKRECHISVLVCPCSLGTSSPCVCLLHSGQLCCSCEPTQFLLITRYFLSDLNAMLKKLGYCSTPNVHWAPPPNWYLLFQQRKHLSKGDQSKHSGRFVSQTGRRLPRSGGLTQILGVEYRDEIPRNAEEPGSEETELGLYFYEKTLAERNSKGKREYLVGWKGFPREQATWEPADEFEFVREAFVG